jgi:hypothetical protein
MPSQYDDLASPDLRVRLRQQEKAAEIELAGRWNRGRPTAKHLQPPGRRATYRQYPLLLLALLWALVRNTRALQVLCARLGVPAPAAPFAVGAMDDGLLERLWTLGRDADALEEYWTRRGLLPVTAADETTPDNVLGYLWWRYRLPAARDELFRRYHHPVPTDGGQLRAVKLLEVCDHWDYLNYPDPRAILAASVGRAFVDVRVKDGRQPGAADDPERVARELDRGMPPPNAAVDAQDTLEVRVPVEFRAIVKLKFNSEAFPVELAADEMDYLVTRNWEHDHPGAPVSQTWARQERDSIETWMANHPKPTAQELEARFPWYNASRTDRAMRIWRLRRHADRNSDWLGRLLPGADGRAEELAFRVQDVLDDLAERTARDNRPVAGVPASGTVPAFADLAEAAAALGPLLREHVRDDDRSGLLDMWQENLAAFADEFRALVKGSACWRLVGRLVDQGVPPPAPRRLRALTAWLKQRRWLASIPTEDKDAAGRCARRLAGDRAGLTGGRRGALELLLLWLAAVGKAEPPEPWLGELDRAWWQSQDAGQGWPAAVPAAAHAVVFAAFAGDWPRAARKVAALRERLAALPAPAPAVRDLLDSLGRLSRALPG